MKAFRQMNDELDALNENDILAHENITPVEIISTLKTVAPLLIIVLTIIKTFTGERADRKIDKVISYLNIIKL